MLNLIEKGVNVNSQDEYDKTPLMWAAAYNNITAAKILLDFGADPDLKSKSGKTAEMYAIDNNYLYMVKILQKYSKIQ